MCKILSFFAYIMQKMMLELRNLDLDVNTKTMLFIKYFEKDDKPMVKIKGQSFYCWEEITRVVIEQIPVVGIETTNPQWVLIFVENNMIKEDFVMKVGSSRVAFSAYKKSSDFWNIYFKIRRGDFYPKQQIHQELEYRILDFTI